MDDDDVIIDEDDDLDTVDEDQDNDEDAVLISKREHDDLQETLALMVNYKM